MVHYDTIDSPCGQILLDADGERLRSVTFAGQQYDARIEPQWRRDPGHPALLRLPG